jgi:hypothetical protein
MAQEEVAVSKARTFTILHHPLIQLALSQQKNLMIPKCVTAIVSLALLG